MANEITVQSNLTHSTGTNGSTVTSATTTDVVNDDSTTKRHALVVQDVGSASTEAITVNDVDTSKQYWARLRNLDTANAVLVYVTSGGSDVEIGRMNAGETWGPCRMKAISGGNPTIKVKGNTATCQVEVITCQCEL